VRSGTDLAFVCDECKVGAPSPHIAFDVADVSFGVSRNDEEIHDGGVEDGEPAHDEGANVSFDVAADSFGSERDQAAEDVDVVQDAGLERSLPEDGEDVQPEGALAITIVPGGSNRGRDKIVDNLGYAYTVKKTYVL